MDEPMLPTFGALIREIREDTDVADLVGVRVRAYEPDEGDAKGASEYQAFVVISQTSDVPERRVPVVFAEYTIRCYGTTSQNARAVWDAVVKALHDRGQRVKSNGLGIYRSAIVGGGSDSRDPDTRQPVVYGTIQLIATTQVVT